MELAPYINSITAEDIGVSVIEGDRYLIYVPCETLDLGIQAGDSIKSPAVLRCMTTGKRVVRKFTEETSKFGVPYIAHALPIMESDRVIGCVVTTQTISSQEEAKAIATDLAASAEELIVDAETLNIQYSAISNVSIAIECISNQLAKAVHSAEELNVTDLMNSLKESVNVLNKQVTAHGSSIREIERATQELTSMAVRLSSVVDKKNVITDT